MSGESLAIPGLVYVGPSSPEEPAPLHVGPTSGWVALKGLRTWSREISLASKADLTEAVCKKLGVTLPEKHPEAAKLENARRAAQNAALVAVEPALVEKLVAEGVRVHTVGSDRTTAGFFYFAKGGSGEAMRVQGNLVEMVAQAMPTADNAALEAALDGLIGRIVTELSQGLLTESQIELAAALPSLGEADGDAVAKLQTLEGFLVLAGSRAKKYEERARAALDAVSQATRQGKSSVNVALFGDARRVSQPEIEVEYAGGESGETRKLTLPERSRWFVTGMARETVAPSATAPGAVDVAKEAAEKAAAERAAAEKAAREKAAAEKAAAEKAAAEKKAAAERAAAEKKVAEERAAAEKRAAEEKAAAEKKAAEEKAAAEKKAAEEKRAAEEKAAAEQKAAEEKAAAEERAAAEAAREKAEAEKAAAESEAEEKEAAEEEREEEGEEEGEEEEERPEAPPKRPIEQPRGMPAWIWFVLFLIAAAGAYYFGFKGHH